MSQCTSSRVASEQRILAKLSHPFIVPFFGASSDEFKTYLLLEASVMGDLSALLRAQAALLTEGQVSGCTDPVADSAIVTHQHASSCRLQARVLIGCLASAVSYVHTSGLMYRDLKPENVIMDEVGLVSVDRRRVRPSTSAQGPDPSRSRSRDG